KRIQEADRRKKISDYRASEFGCRHSTCAYSRLRKCHLRNTLACADLKVCGPSFDVSATFVEKNRMSEAMRAWRSNRKPDFRVVAWQSTADLRAVARRSNRKPDLRVVAKSEKREEEETPTPQDVFEGVKGRPPKSDQELKEWLASPEGKA